MVGRHGWRKTSLILVTVTGMRWLLGFYAKGLFDETLWLELTIGEKGTASGAGVSMNWDDPRKR